MNNTALVPQRKKPFDSYKYALHNQLQRNIDIQTELIKRYTQEREELRKAEQKEEKHARGA